MYVIFLIFFILYHISEGMVSFLQMGVTVGFEGLLDLSASVSEPE